MAAACDDCALSLVWCGRLVAVCQRKDIASARAVSVKCCVVQSVCAVVEMRGLNVTVWARTGRCGCSSDSLSVRDRVVRERDQPKLVLNHHVQSFDYMHVELKQPSAL